jgi:hypothetical protein
VREQAVGESLWEAVLPEELRELLAELGKVDGILDDDRFLAPFAPGSRPRRSTEELAQLFRYSFRFAASVDIP